MQIGLQAAGSDGHGGKPPGSDRRLRLALVHRPTAALAADRVPTVLVQNWGLAIIMLTLLVRGIMFPLTKAQYTSMAKMQHAPAQAGCAQRTLR